MTAYLFGDDLSREKQEKDGLLGYGLVHYGNTRGSAIFVWILSTATIPQPRNIRGIWLENEIWSATSVWYQ